MKGDWFFWLIAVAVPFVTWKGGILQKEFSSFFSCNEQEIMV